MHKAFSLKATSPIYKDPIHLHIMGHKDPFTFPKPTIAYLKSGIYIQTSYENLIYVHIAEGSHNKIS